jgi:hypothetical protein
MKALHLDGPLHRIGMHSECLGDRAHLPVLGVKVAADLNPHLWIDHLCSPARTCARKRIDETPGPAADHTAQSSVRPIAPPNAQRRDRRRRDRSSTLRWWRRNDRLGTLIRHAAPQSPAIGTLTVAMIQTTLNAPLMTPIRRTMLTATRLTPALRAAVALAAITARTYPEHRPAL